MRVIKTPSSFVAWGARALRVTWCEGCSPTAGPGRPMGARPVYRRERSEGACRVAGRSNPADLGLRGAHGAGGAPLEEPDERERQGPGILVGPPRARPQRGGGVVSANSQ